MEKLLEVQVSCKRNLKIQRYLIGFFMIIWFTYFGAVHFGYSVDDFFELFGSVVPDKIGFTPDIMERQIQNPPIVLQDKITDMTKGIPHIDPKSKYWPFFGDRTSVNNLELKEHYLGTEPINMFLVPHTHLDPGWIETFEDYYIKKVKLILINVVQQLMKHDHKRFTWCETSFMHRFLIDHTIP
jgi:hypothetical protein